MSCRKKFSTVTNYLIDLSKKGKHEQLGEQSILTYVYILSGFQ
jgi:hypothetical protein